MITTMKKIFQSVLFLILLLLICGSVITGCGWLNNGAGQGFVPPNSVEILQVGNKLQPFTLNDTLSGIVDSNMGTTWITGKEIIGEHEYGPGVIKLQEKGAWIELKNGTRYECLTVGGCSIRWKDYTIIQGEIRASYKK